MYVVLISVALFFISISAQSPNILLIIADDLGWNDVSYHGSNEIPTPNIDALAYNGMILNRFYTQEACTPSRSALLTGQYPIRMGFQGRVLRPGENIHLPYNLKLLPEKLKELGYKTALIGKWHLGSAYKNVTPTYRGFDYHFGYWNGYIGYYNHFCSYENATGFDMHDNFIPSWDTQYEYSTHLFTRKARKIIMNHNVSHPLFLMVSHAAPHAGQRDIVFEVPDVRRNNQKFYYIPDNGRRKYAGWYRILISKNVSQRKVGMVDELDRSVGELIKSLAEKGILNDTIILFISDNGAQTVGASHVNKGSNWPLRGVKFTPLEGGIRNVASLYYSKLKAKSVTYNSFIHITDLFPTLYTAAGGNSVGLQVDGIDQWSALMNNQKGPRQEILVNIENVEKWSAYIGRGRFKLVNNSRKFYDGFYGSTSHGLPYNVNKVLRSTVNFYLNANLTSDTILKLRRENNLAKLKGQYDGHSCNFNNLCLFDIINDPCETRNVAEEYPDIVNELSAKVSYYWSQLYALKKRMIDPASNPIFFNNTWTTWLDI